MIIIIINCDRQNQVLNDNTQDRTQFLGDLKKRTFFFFWDLMDKPTWQIPDRHPTVRFSSIASTGFGLTAYIIGAENEFVTRAEAAERVFNTLNWFWQSRQGPDSTGTTGHRGFYYHFLNYGDGTRFQNVELSTIDTGLLMAGILACQSYFDRENETETKIRNLADSLFLRVEWDWAMEDQETMSMGWHPERGFIKARWTGYNEAMILLIMALGSPTHPIPPDSWENWCETYRWENFMGYEHVNFTPLFGHQYSHMFIDFREIKDPYMRDKGIDYFENSVRATLSNRAYCIENPGHFIGYKENLWGLTACDGPAGDTQVINGDTIDFWTYRARGASAIRVVDDGTIAPTAAGGSIPFAPEECITALMTMKNKLGDRLYQEYGFKDAFNLTYTDPINGENGWIDHDYLGIDQGPILIQLENHHTELIWNVMKKNKYIISGFKKAGFTGGWLEKTLIAEVQNK
ncbi:MAG: Tat pathway signal protein [Cyclobacteriaceae bacterium]|nr:Tat pathway signal protein [Cyclobacteriaceae bacterium]